jgi:hypothetical protein
MHHNDHNEHTTCFSLFLSPFFGAKKKLPIPAVSASSMWKLEIKYKNIKMPLCADSVRNHWFMNCENLAIYKQCT